MDRKKKMMLLGVTPYYKKIINTQPANLIRYIPLWDASGTVATDLSVNADQGTYTGGVMLSQAGIGDGKNSVLFNGSTGCVDIYSAGFLSRFTGVLFSVSMWLKLPAASWNDTTYDRAISLYVDGSNEFLIRKTNTQNQLQFYHRAQGATASSVVDTSLAGTINWFHVACTINKASNEMKAFINGVQVGTTQAVNGTWVGSLSSTQTVIGSEITSTITQGWSGNIAHVGIWKSVLTPTEIARLADKHFL